MKRKSLKQLLNHGWTISLVTAVFSILLTATYDILKSKPFFSTIGITLSWIFKTIMAFLLLKVTVYWILITIVVIILMLWILSRKQTTNQIYSPDFHNYVSDNFKGLRWSWRWKFNEEQKSWNVNYLHAHCPKCDTKMLTILNGIIHMWECPRCESRSLGAQHSDLEKIEMLILDGVDKKVYKQNFITK